MHPDVETLAKAWAKRLALAEKAIALRAEFDAKDALIDRAIQRIDNQVDKCNFSERVCAALFPELTRPGAIVLHQGLPWRVLGVCLPDNYVTANTWKSFARNPDDTSQFMVRLTALQVNGLPRKWELNARVVASEGIMILPETDSRVKRYRRHLAREALLGNVPGAR